MKKPITNEQKIRDLLEDPNIGNPHPADLALLLTKLREEDESKFFEILGLIPKDILGEVILELPESASEEVITSLSKEDLLLAAKEMESDDATDLIQEIEEVDSLKGQQIISGLEKKDRDEINVLKQYHEEQAGSIMQSELFKAEEGESISKAIKRLAKLKAKKELNNVYQVFIVDSFNLLKGSIALEDLITLNDFNKTFGELLIERKDPELITIKDFDSIESVVKIFEKYDMGYVPVINSEGKLMGRVTSDDIFDAIEERATEQIYNLAGLDDEEEYGDLLFGVVRKRGFWLFINLMTAFLASIIIGIFDETIQKIVPLAILMPIVASMGGNAGTQSLTVMVRQLALGAIDTSNARKALRKEIVISLINGFFFAILVGIISHLWFKIKLLGIIMGASIIINLLVAGFFGAIIPLVLKKLKTDPAFGSAVVLTTVTDIVGFFTFLGLAKLIL